MATKGIVKLKDTWAVLLLNMVERAPRTLVLQLSSLHSTSSTIYSIPSVEEMPLGLPIGSQGARGVCNRSAVMVRGRRRKYPGRVVAWDRSG